MSRSCVVVRHMRRTCNPTTPVRSILGRGSPANQAVHHSGVGKLVAIIVTSGGQLVNIAKSTAGPVMHWPRVQDLRVASRWPSASEKEMGNSRCSLRSGSDLIDFFKFLNFMWYLSVYWPKLIESMLFSPSLMVHQVAIVSSVRVHQSGVTCGVTIDCPRRVVEQSLYERFYNMLT